MKCEVLVEEKARGVTVTGFFMLVAYIASWKLSLPE